MNNKIYLSSPHMGEGELKHIHEAFDTNWVSTVGPQIDGLEKTLSEYTGIGHTAALASGTAALHLALRILGAGPGDFVLCQSFTFAGTANPVTYTGATPVFIGSEPHTWNMCPVALEQALEKLSKQPGGGKVRAIIPVHLYGCPANMPEINAVAAKYGVPVVEDAAEALGASIDGKMCGSWGEMAVLSFNGNKIITTSGGGALLSDNLEYINKARFLATQARDPAPHYEHTHIGYNYRMGNINAAIGLGQMEVLNERVKRRREVYNIYWSELKEHFKFQCPTEDLIMTPKTPQEEGPLTKHQTDQTTNSPNQQIINSPNHKFTIYPNRWLTTILTQSFEQREKIRLALEAENIESRPLWKPMHLQPVFKDAPFFGDNTSDDLFTRGLCLPSGSNLTTAQQEQVIELIKKNLN